MINKTGLTKSFFNPFLNPVTFLIVFSVLINVTLCTIRCPRKQPPIDLDKDKSYYECPSPFQLPEYIDCCPGSDKCCLPARQERYLNSQVIYLVSLTGITICIIFIITFTLCFFHPSCPSYNTCHKNYTRDNTAHADKMGEASSLFSEMPGETSPLGNTMVIAHPIEDKPKACEFDKAREVAV